MINCIHVCCSYRYLLENQERSMNSFHHLRSCSVATRWDPSPPCCSSCGPKLQLSCPCIVPLPWWPARGASLGNAAVHSYLPAWLPLNRSPAERDWDAAPDTASGRVHPPPKLWRTWYTYSTLEDLVSDWCYRRIRTRKTSMSQVLIRSRHFDSIH